MLVYYDQCCVTILILLQSSYLSWIIFHSAYSSSKIVSIIGRRRCNYTSERWKSNCRSWSIHGSKSSL